MTSAADALALQQQGRHAEAAMAYERLLATDPWAPGARHNLGLLRLEAGEIAAALPLLEQAWVEDGHHAAWATSLPLVGMRLYEAGLWEAAWPWLERAAARQPAGVPLDPRVARALERLRPRAHLAPEVWDEGRGRMLLRQVPRESTTYVYAIDVVGTCNLRCPTCPVGNFTAADRPVGFMAPELFERILDKIVAERVAAAPEIWLFNWGEPLLHPQLPALVRAVKSRGLRVHLSSNLNVDRGLKELARANPDDLKISLSGFTAEGYARTHARGSLRLVIANLHALRHWLDEAKATTRVWVGHHLYKGGEAEIPAVRALCDELGFEHHPIAAFYQPLERLFDLLEGTRPPDAIHAALIEPPAVYLKRIAAQRSERHDCELRFNQTVINHDGMVALCCNVYDRPNMLGMHFLDTPQAELEAAKYRHPTCRRCFDHGVAYVPRDALKVQRRG